MLEPRSGTTYYSFICVSIYLSTSTISRHQARLLRLEGTERGDFIFYVHCTGLFGNLTEKAQSSPKTGSYKSRD